MDCLARSRHTSASEWLAFIDLDEFLLPPQLDSISLWNFISDHARRGVASICIGRTDVRGPSILSAGNASSQLPMLSYISTQKPPSADQRKWNMKCIHRADAVELVYVHWAESHRDGKPDGVVNYPVENEQVPQILHVRHASLDKEPFDMAFSVTPELGNWVKEIWTVRDKLMHAFKPDGSL